MCRPSFYWPLMGHFSLGSFPHGPVHVLGVDFLKNDISKEIAL